MDVNIQSILESELAEGLKKYNAKEISGLVMELPSGEIRAVANLPSFHPASFEKFPIENQKLRLITDQVEPGSVLKLIPFAYLLENNLVNLSDSVDCSQGYVTIGRHTIHDVKVSHNLNAKQALVLSSNVATYEFGKDIPNKDLYDLYNNFGFLKRTGIHLPGEATGSMVSPDKWRGITNANILIGYGTSATMLQIANAYATIANGGTSVKPSIIKGKIYRNNNIVYDKTSKGKRIVSEKTSLTMTDWLVEAVENGTGKSARIKNVKIAGKTGTAAKIDPATNRYSQRKYIATFVGYFPAYNPQYLILITLDEPYPLTQGGQVAAPIFKNVAERQIGLNPLLLTIDETIKNTIKSEAQETKIDEQSIAEMHRTLDDDMTIVPNFINMSLRDAIKIATSSGLDITINGNGRVIRQRPREGSVVKIGTRCEVTAVG